MQKKKQINEERVVSDSGEFLESENEITVTTEEEKGDESEVAIRKLKKKLAECEKERREYLDGWQRVKADFVNARREDDETRKKLLFFAKEDVLLSMLPVADSFELAFGNKESWERVEEGWRKGVLSIYAQLVKIFQENGLEQFSPEGDTFDPTKHESVETVSSVKEIEHNKILAVLQKGYALNGKIVRPAKVRVGIFNM